MTGTCTGQAPDPTRDACLTVAWLADVDAPEALASLADTWRTAARAADAVALDADAALMADLTGGATVDPSRTRALARTLADASERGDAFRAAASHLASYRREREAGRWARGACPRSLVVAVDAARAAVSPLAPVT